MALTYYDFEKLKKIIPDQGHEQWLASLQTPTDNNKWAETLLTFLERFATENNIQISIDKLRTLFNNNKDLAYKFYVIYIQEKEHHFTAIFHRTIAESSLFNFLENSINCPAGSNERLNSIIASFLLTENNIQSIIQSFRTELVQRIFSAYAAEKPLAEAMEVHFKAAFERAAKEALHFNIHAPEENRFNTPSESIINFLQSKLPLFNHPFQLLEFIASQFHWATHVAMVKEKNDFISSLKTTLDLTDVIDESVFVNSVVNVNGEETYPTALNKKYIRQLICQKLCELEVFAKAAIFVSSSQQYILPKPDSTNENVFSSWFEYFATPDSTNENVFSSWFEHFATEEEQRNLTAAEKRNLLIFSAKNGHEKLVTLLIDAGANVNKADSQGKTPLMLAAERGHKELVTHLISKGADVNKADSQGKTPLMLAAEKRYLDVVEILIDKRATFNEDEKNNLLNLSAMNGHEKLVTLLISKGASVNQTVPSRNVVDWGKTPLMLAAQNGRINVVKTLMENNADVNQTVPSRNVVDSGKTALMLAAKHGHNDVAIELIDKGATFNEDEKKNLLILSAKHGYINLLSRLTEKAPIPANPRSLKGNLLSLSAENGHKEVVTHLISKGADVNARYLLFKTPLMLAVENGHNGVAIELIDAGASFVLDYQGQTPLMLAAQNGNLEVVQKLIEKGADPNVKNHNTFKTALQLAIDAKQWKAARYLTLQKHNRNWNSTVLSTITGWGLVRSLANLGYDILWMDRNPSFALMLMTQTQRQALYVIDKEEKRTSNPQP